MVYETKLSVRTYECDSYGHVNNANYLNYLEFARWDFLKQIGFDNEAILEGGYAVYVARIEIDYKKSARTDDELVIKTWAIKKGAVSGILQQQILRGEELIIEAKVTWAFVDRNGMPVKIPKELDVKGLSPANDYSQTN
jgi:acyl-CoA thioester hydrolase